LRAKLVDAVVKGLREFDDKEVATLAGHEPGHLFGLWDLYSEEGKKKEMEAASNAAKLKTLANLDIYIISREEFIEMLVNKEENLGKIFDPFFTTKSDTGTGLGLSVYYGIIERHGGKIEVQSRLNEGTTLTVKLPLLPRGKEPLTASRPSPSKQA